MRSSRACSARCPSECQRSRASHRGARPDASFAPPARHEFRSRAVVHAPRTPRPCRRRRMLCGSAPARRLDTSICGNIIRTNVIVSSLAAAPRRERHKNKDEGSSQRLALRRHEEFRAGRRCFRTTTPPADDSSSVRAGYWMPLRIDANRTGTGHEERPAASSCARATAYATHMNEE